MSLFFVSVVCSSQARNCNLDRFKLLQIIVAFALVSQVAHVVAYDEIQVYDMSINQPGQFALEMHSNYVINGRKQADYVGELSPDGQLALTPEFSYGWSR